MSCWSSRGQDCPPLDVDVVSPWLVWFQSSVWTFLLCSTHSCSWVNLHVSPVFLWVLRFAAGGLQSLLILCNSSSFPRGADSARLHLIPQWPLLTSHNGAVHPHQSHCCCRGDGETATREVKRTDHFRELRSVRIFMWVQTEAVLSEAHRSWAGGPSQQDGLLEGFKNRFSVGKESSCL